MNKIKIIFVAACAGLLLIATGCGNHHKDLDVLPPITADSRPFLMGFTRWPPDLSEASVEIADRFIEQHADLAVVHLLGGIPWPEAFGGLPYPKDVNTQLSYRPPSGKKLYVSVTPLDMDRSGIAPYWGERDNMPLPPAWRDARLDSPEVKKAYGEFLMHIVDEMHPDYLNIGVEANLLITKNPNAWPAYVELHKYCYRLLKEKYPDLPVFVSIEVLHLNGLADKSDKDTQYRLVKDLMTYSDLFGMSVYPYMSYQVPRPMPSGFLDFARQFGRPIAVAESGYTSKDVWIFVLPLFGSEDLQTDFVSKLLSVAVRDRYLFVVNFATTDFEKLVKKLPYMIGNMAKIWQNTGLQDSHLRPKKALSIWDSYFRLEYKPRD
ncbi:glycosyl hydrolase 53 family protein [Methylocaldum marinum]|nr:glycosyl hydrolase 53 family protein [Methylocaldum marinum]